MKLLATPRGRWYTLAVLWAILLTLGVGGFLQQSRDAGLHRSTLDTLYLTVQLGTLEYEGGDEALNWRLQVARFVAPLMAFGTVILTASVVFHDQFKRFGLRFARGHTIVCGLGDAGSRLAVALTEAGRRVAAIEPNKAASGITAARAGGVTVLAGDATATRMLEAAGIERAARLVVVCGSDATNVEIAAAARRIDRPDSEPALRCSVRLTDAELCALLRAGDLDARGEARVGFFNLHEVAARAWVAAHPPFGDGSTPPRPLVVGLGRLGRNLVVAMAQRWADIGDGKPLPITLVDRAASGRWEALCLQHPALEEACQPTLLDLDLEAPTADAVDAFTAMLEEERPTSVAVVFGDESLALSSALSIHQRIGDGSVSVIVRARADGGLAALLSPIASGERPPFPGMALFPFLDRTCVPETVEGGLREQLARAVHEDYLAHVGAGDGLRRPWDQLDDDERDPSRRRVDSLIADLDLLGCDLVPLRRWGAPLTMFSEEEVERLAAREHARWFDDRTAAGWTYGPVRDDAAKQNPLLVPWTELPTDTRAMNLDGLRALPAMLARAGFEPLRR